MTDESKSWIVEAAGLTDVAELIGDAIWAHGPTAVVETLNSPSVTKMTAGFATRHAARSAAHTLRRLPYVSDVSIAEGKAGDEWTSNWRSSAEPHHIGDFHVRLGHHPPSRETTDLIVEPGRSFGYGHPSTRLILETIRSDRLSGETVADVGTGSGILAIAADLAGAARVDAVDTDPVALNTARMNLARNSSSVNLHQGSVSDLPLAAYDVVLANLTAATLVELAAELEARVGPGGFMTISGILDEQLESVLDAFELAPGHVEHLSGWAAVTLRRPPRAGR